ncbi:phosphotransferase [Bacillus sp. FJAT-53711]|uniref:Phosphotransferase n=1 Tax=Bacillus yunxiaonensis TaxID=3127665 RepID=A0ABU8FUI8_9BACI
MKTLYEAKTLSGFFGKLRIAEKLSYSMNERVVIDSDKIECLKSTRRSSIYKLLLRTKADYYPIILKIYNSGDYKNEIEINIYDRAYPILKEFLPEIYLIEQNGNETWIFMEFVRQVRGQITFSPKHFDYIIPTVAKLHAHTFEDKVKKHKDVWESWLPIYESSRMRSDRAKYIRKTIDFLDDAMKDDRLRVVIKPHYKSLIKLCNKGPDFFPELFENGSSITHGDLHMQNICSNNVTLNAPWNIQFIDWESTKYAPVWFDMVVLVEILMGFRKDWQSRAEEIRTHCVEFYAKEMKKNGITFKNAPIDLYKMAYLQRTLEKGLHTQLRRIFDNRGGELLPYHLEKISTWGKELGL